MFKKMLILFISFQAAICMAADVKVLVPQGNLADGLVALTPQFEKETGISVDIVAFPWQQMFEKANSMSETKSAAFDIVFADDPWMPNIVTSSTNPLDGGYSLNLTKRFNVKRDPDVFKVSYDVFSWPPPYGPTPKDYQNLGPSELHALPIVGNVIMFYIRKDKLFDLGLEMPETWDDVLSIAEKVHCPGCNPPFYGYNMRGSSGSDALTLIWSMGGAIFDDKFNVVLDNKAGCGSFEMLAKLSKYLPPGGSTFETTEMGAEVLGGRAMMGIGWPGDTFAAWENPRESQSAGKLGYSPLPASRKGGPRPSMMGHWGLVLNKYGNNIDKAWKFATWMHSKEHSLDYALEGGIPFRKSVFADYRLVQKFPWYPAQAAQISVPPAWRPRSKMATGIVSGVVGPMFSAVASGTKGPQEACKQAAEEIRFQMEDVTD